jgi:hypothetical protein
VIDFYALSKESAEKQRDIVADYERILRQVQDEISSFTMAELVEMIKNNVASFDAATHRPAE